MLLHGRVGAVQEGSVGMVVNQWTRAIRFGRDDSYLVAALASEVWQKRKRSSFRPWVKTYLPDMVGCQERKSRVSKV